MKRLLAPLLFALALLAAVPARAQSLPLPVLELGANWTCQPPVALSAYQYNLKTGTFQQGVALLTGYGCTWRGWKVPLGVALYGGLAVNANAPNAAQGSLMFSVADTFAFGIGAQVFRSPADQSLISQGLLMVALNYNVGGSVAGVRNFGLRTRAAGMTEGASRWSVPAGAPDVHMVKPGEVLTWPPKGSDACSPDSMALMFAAVAFDADAERKIDAIKKACEGARAVRP